MNRPIFTMLCGLPGSGKSTYAKNYHKKQNQLFVAQMQSEKNYVVMKIHKRIMKMFLKYYTKELKRI